MGSGGNGRALLYSKYDSAGNVVQVSLHRIRPFCIGCDMMGDRNELLPI